MLWHAYIERRIRDCGDEQDSGCSHCKAREKASAAQSESQVSHDVENVDDGSIAATSIDFEEDSARKAGVVNRRGNKNAPPPELEIFTFQSLRKRTSFMKAKAAGMHTRMGVIAVDNVEEDLLEGGSQTAPPNADKVPLNDASLQVHTDPSHGSVMHCKKAQMCGCKHVHYPTHSTHLDHSQSQRTPTIAVSDRLAFQRQITSIKVCNISYNGTSHNGMRSRHVLERKTSPRSCTHKTCSHVGSSARKPGGRAAKECRGETRVECGVAEDTRMCGAGAAGGVAAETVEEAQDLAEKVLCARLRSSLLVQ